MNIVTSECVHTVPPEIIEVAASLYRHVANGVDDIVFIGQSHDSEYGWYAGVLHPEVDIRVHWVNAGGIGEYRVSACNPNDGCEEDSMWTSFIGTVLNWTWHKIGKLDFVWGDTEPA